MPLFLLLAGCWPATQPEPEPEPEEPEPVVLQTWSPWGYAGWDPQSFQVSPEEAAETAWPVVRDADGGYHPYDRLLSREGHRLGFLPRATLAPGVYDLTRITGVPAPTLRRFRVLPYGQDPAFDPAAVIGTFYAVDVDSLRLVEPIGVGSIVLSYLEEAALQIRSVDAEGAHFRIVANVGEDAWCDVLRATGTLSPTGLFTWSQDAIEVPTDPAPTHLQELSLRLGFLADGSAAGGVEGGATADLGVVDSLGGDVCGFVQSFGSRCWDCLEDGSDSCLDAAFYAGTLAPADLALPDELPSCGVDLEETSEAITCEFEGGLCAFSFVPSLFLVGAAFRRRRSPTEG